MTEFFRGIQTLFEDFLFIPLDYLRNLQLDYWWLANLINFIFVIIAMIAFGYWLMQLKKFQDEERENASHSA